MTNAMHLNSNIYRPALETGILGILRRYIKYLLQLAISTLYLPYHVFRYKYPDKNAKPTKDI